MSIADLADTHALLCFAAEYHGTIVRALEKAAAAGACIPDSTIIHHRKQADDFTARASGAADRLILARVEMNMSERLGG